MQIILSIVNEIMRNFPLFQVAIKIIDTSQITQEYVIKDLTREAKLLSMLHHPNIVKLYETIQVRYLSLEVRKSD